MATGVSGKSGTREKKSKHTGSKKRERCGGQKKARGLTGLTSQSKKKTSTASRGNSGGGKKDEAQERGKPIGSPSPENTKSTLKGSKVKKHSRSKLKGKRRRGNMKKGK